MIQMLGMIATPAIGMNKSEFDKAIKQTEQALGLTEAGENDPHAKGTAWRQDNGRWSGKSKEGYIRSFDDEAAARKYASGSDNDHLDPKGAELRAKAGVMKYDDGTPVGSGPYRDRYRFKKESILMNSRLKEMVKEEYVKLAEEAKEQAPKIEKKLEDMRKKMCEEFVKREQQGVSFTPALEKRIQIQTVAELIDVPVNELFLYFINEVKTKNEHQLVEYRMGHVYFYGN